ncbi:UDP-N-acetylmuramoyl-L-alanyl-D-glutamate--2,6-diaminopimelate ligase [Oceanobacillus piezotolerans]|uniref:UDP-N-acetylmuramoyl-L-alanyl-D-glutamate--2, 6-diaminopimelate ligase n=1 Tax=Oceanobacillus piezotolerans TaxID=2448030 RepID=A0A498DA03_9BACI|nr:UDP-N-acetylmuramoyl-L-alanyl-D-glutamate--2,6-diaminopimelate ligase [Oceanobacillus piezotolerans]RLL46564.1 UDP-N-acetylmuramoyl-L-alanyl-D-glutamate--2,6-diaminopimelate ligase [Oceanobacillus piezotolerans]
MKANQLLDNIEVLNNIDLISLNIEIKGITDSSININNGDLFVAIAGNQMDGHDYIEDAINKGAAAIVGEKEYIDLPVPYLQVPNTRKALGKIAKAYYNNKDDDKIIIGITGTNGKTTTSYFLKNLIEKSKRTCGLIGTIEYIINGDCIKSVNTTPSALVLHKLLQESKDEVIIIEVSSHGLHQSRVEGISFDVCIFTNLEQEHLDYHQTMDHYFQSKLLLFQHLKDNGVAIINGDNAWGRKAADLLQASGKTVYTVGQASTCRFQINELDPICQTFQIIDNGSSHQIHLPIPGIHNRYNAAFAFASGKCLGLDSTQLCEGFAEIKGVHGRFEKRLLPNGAMVIIDYAHTTAAIQSCLTTAKQHGAKRIIHIFGFRGNRDERKRKDMLSISATESDYYILTMDDLNSVAAFDMLQTLDYLHESYGNDNGILIADRTMAIKWAIDLCMEGDWIIITGKGHEAYQQEYVLETKSDQETVDYLMDRQEKRKQVLTV